MANIRARVQKDGKTVRYNVQVRRDGYPTRTATFPSRRAAERWAATVETRMIEGRHGISASGYNRTLAEAIDTYEGHPNGLLRLRNGIMHTTCLPYWRRALGAAKLGQISGALIIQHRDRLVAEPYVRAKPDSPNTLVKKGSTPRTYKRRPNTVNNYMRVLSAVFSFAKNELHWIAQNPMSGMSKLPPDGKEDVRRPLTSEERPRVLKEVVNDPDPQLHLLVMLSICTGARATELRELRWADIEFAERMAVLRYTKNGEPRAIWLNTEIVRLLKEHKDRRIHPERVFIGKRGGRTFYYRKPFLAALERARVTNFKFHGLRHTFGTVMARRGMSGLQLKAAGGWKSDVVNRYVHLAAEDYREPVLSMNEEILAQLHNSQKEE